MLSVYQNFTLLKFFYYSGPSILYLTNTLGYLKCGWESMLDRDSPTSCKVPRAMSKFIRYDTEPFGKGFSRD